MKMLLMFVALACVFLSGTAFMLAPHRTPAAGDELRQLSNSAFKEGEYGQFRVYYGWFTAGTAEFSIEPKTQVYNGRECYRMHAHVKTASSFEWFFKMKNEFHTYVDKQSIIPWQYTRSSREGDWRFADTVSFDHNQGKVKGVKGKFEMPKYTQDVMSAYYYARCLDLRNAKPGAVYDIPTFLDDKVYHLGLTVMGREVLDTPIGKVRTIKIIPKLIDGKVFTGDDKQMQIWVSDDENLIPIHVESPVIIGSIKCDLIKYKNVRNPFTALVK